MGTGHCLRPLFAFVPAFTPGIGIMKGSFPGRSSTTPCRRRCGIFHVGANNGDNGRNRHYVPLHCPDGYCPIQPTPYKTLQLVTQAFSISLSLPCTHTLIGLEPIVSVSVLYTLFPHTLFLLRDRSCPCHSRSVSTLDNAQTILYCVYAPACSASSAVRADVHRN